MKLTFPLLLVGFVLLLSNCKNNPDALKFINSESFPEQQIQIQFSVPSQGFVDTITSPEGMNRSLEEMLTMTEQIRQKGSDQQWPELLRRWQEFNSNHFNHGSSLSSENLSLAYTVKEIIPGKAAEKWARLNVDLLKLSGQVRFGDALERLLYGNQGYAVSDSLQKSIIYTHVFDDIYINIIGSSSLEYEHTTGGMVRLSQQTNYPKEFGMTLSFEADDVRFLNVFIRIPGWAENPSVSYGNVKYVAQPGEYTQISKKWHMGDEIRVELKN